MPASERASLVVTGAVVGVLGVLALLFGLVTQLDARYVTTKEYTATMAGINTQLADIKANVQAIRKENEKQ